MLENILSALKENNIAVYLIRETKKETVELFFIKKNLDMRRMKKVHDYEVTVYRDYDVDGTTMRGSSVVGIYHGMTKEDISSTLKNAYYAASFVKNPYYPLPKGQKKDLIQMSSSLSHHTMEENISKMTEALFAEDQDTNVFINSAEIFITKIMNHIINSEGVDVSYSKDTVSGEFVVQCIEPQDVETYQNFSYDNLNTEELKEKVKEVLQITKDRALATSTPAAGDYNVILTGDYIKTLLSYYTGRSASYMIYPKYSNYTVGMNVQGENVVGDSLNLTLKAKEPYSEEGIPMVDRPLITNGALNVIHGGSRFAHYLNIEPTGNYHSFSLPAGEKSFDELKSGKYLHVVNFSDFQMDSYSGHFGGEIRLAYLFDGDNVTPVTGGSINGSILEAGKDLTFSKEMQVQDGYEGPFAVLLKNVSVAGE